MDQIRSVRPAAIAGERLSYTLRPCGWGSGRLSDRHERAQLYTSTPHAPNAVGEPGVLAKARVFRALVASMLRAVALRRSMVLVLGVVKPNRESSRATRPRLPCATERAQLMGSDCNFAVAVAKSADPMRMRGQLCANALVYSPAVHVISVRLNICYGSEALPHMCYPSRLVADSCVASYG